MAHDRRILIADDDVEIRHGMADLLHGLGLEILQAATGDEALRIVRGRELALALLDHQMPGRTGLEIILQIRSETLEVPCIFCSGDVNDALERMALDAGALVVLKKPVQPNVLRREVARVLSLSPPA